MNSLTLLRKPLPGTVFGLFILFLILAAPRPGMAFSPQTEEKILLVHSEKQQAEECCPREGEHPEGPGGHGRKHRGEGGGHGPGGQGGMGHGMMGQGMHGGRMHDGKEATALCPQPRSTAKAPDAIYNRVNPLEKTAANVEKGRLLYQLDVQPTCTMCHGRLGDGTGMMGGGLNPPPRNFTCSETMQGLPDGQLFWIIQNGSTGTGMPAFSGLNEDQIWQVVLYLREFVK